jgi:hypothetical protein
MATAAFILLCIAVLIIALPANNFPAIAAFVLALVALLLTVSPWLFHR